MKKGYCDISIVLDRSGSMEFVRDDTIGGFNTFLRDQKKAPGEATISLIQFDNEYEVVYEGEPLLEAPELTKTTYLPRGSTALLDAIGRTIDRTGARLSKMREEDRPDRVLFVILTDGEENASREFSKEKINKAISHQRDAYSWDFIFLGANQDAITTAASMSIPRSSSMTYSNTVIGMAATFGAMSSNVANYRSAPIQLKAAATSFTTEQKEEQENLIHKFGH